MTLALRTGSRKKIRKGVHARQGAHRGKYWPEGQSLGRILPIKRQLRSNCWQPERLHLGIKRKAQGKEAATEFQKILDHSSIVWNCCTGALAHLGVARANALQAKTSQGADADAARVRALAAHKDFLTLWRDPDPGIPVPKQAKAEYAKLQ